MNLGTRYYRLALAAAARRDLTAAVLYSRHALLFAPENPGAAKLLRICRCELGETEEAAPDEGLEKVERLAIEKKWRDAARAACALPGQDVRILNIRGCLWALAGDYEKAVDSFARALKKDHGSRLAAEGLAEITFKRKRFWNILGRIL
jgi:Flp pilus assembly protein TadD